MNGLERRRKVVAVLITQRFRDFGDAFLPTAQALGCLGHPEMAQPGDGPAAERRFKAIDERGPVGPNQPGQLAQRGLLIDGERYEQPTLPLLIETAR